MKETAHKKTTAFETAFETAAFKAAIFKTIPISDALLMHLNATPTVTPVNENDDLYRELERRYGGGYAQDIVEGLKKSQKR